LDYPAIKQRRVPPVTVRFDFSSWQNPNAV